MKKVKLNFQQLNQILGELSGLGRYDGDRFVKTQNGLMDSDIDVDIRLHLGKLVTALGDEVKVFKKEEKALREKIFGKDAETAMMNPKIWVVNENYLAIIKKDDFVLQFVDGVSQFLEAKQVMSDVAEGDDRIIIGEPNAEPETFISVDRNELKVAKLVDNTKLAELQKQLKVLAETEVEVTTWPFTTLNFKGVKTKIQPALFLEKIVEIAFES